VASLRDFSATRVRVDVGDHPTIENGFSILPAIVDVIQTDDGVRVSKTLLRREAEQQQQQRRRRFGSA
jgi:hypothetical protein